MLMNTECTMLFGANMHKLFAVVILAIMLFQNIYALPASLNSDSVDTVNSSPESTGQTDGQTAGSSSAALEPVNVATLYCDNDNTDNLDLTKFCKDLDPGVYCHPLLGRKRIFCNVPSASNNNDNNNPLEPVSISCPKDHFCRSHKKLHKIFDQKQFTASAETTVNEWSQCIAINNDPYDEFCEDKLTDSLSSLGNGMQQTDVDLIRSNFTGVNDELLHVVRQCNPFNSRRREMLDCMLVKRKCSMQFQGSQCLDTIEIVPKISKCLGTNVCRNFGDGVDEIGMAKCHSSSDAMCLDRFWAHYNDEFTSSIRARTDFAETAPNSVIDPIGTGKIAFKFCDGFYESKQIECEIEWNVFTPHERVQDSVLPESEQASLKEAMQSRYPLLYQEIYNQPAPIKYRFEPKSVKLNQISCPATNVYLKDLNPNTPNIDPNAAVSGPQCMQLSTKVSRCLPPLTIDVSSVEGHESATEGTTVYGNAKPGEYAGFCAGKTHPGQYCVAGWLDVGVLCPSGVMVECQRPKPESWESETDFYYKLERCVQKFGDIPAVDGNSTDAFRHHSAVDLQGNTLDNGWWATCATNLEELYDLSSLPSNDVTI